MLLNFMVKVWRVINSMTEVDRNILKILFVCVSAHLKIRKSFGVIPEAEQTEIF